MATVKVETSVTVDIKVESDAPADLFKSNLSPMDIDLPDRKPLKDDPDDVKDEPESEDDESSLSMSPESSTSRSNSPRPAPKEKKGPQLIGHLPRAERDAMKTFTQLPDNFYQYQTLGRSREALESMTCDCSFTPGTPLSNLSFLLPYVVFVEECLMCWDDSRCRRPRHGVWAQCGLHQPPDSGRVRRWRLSVQAILSEPKVR